MLEFLKKWSLLLAATIVLVGGIIWAALAMKPKDDRGKFIEIGSELELDGVRYKVVNDMHTDAYIGSQVADVIRAQIGERIASVSSGGMPVAVIYKVQNDANGKYIMDTSGNIYVKAEDAEAERERLGLFESFPIYKVTRYRKRFDDMVRVSEEGMRILIEYAESPHVDVSVNSSAIAENLGERREIIAFTEDEALYHPVYELFLYEEKVYLTVRFYDKKSSPDHKTTVQGMRLPEELQKEFRPLWR